MLRTFALECTKLKLKLKLPLIVMETLKIFDNNEILKLDI